MQIIISDNLAFTIIMLQILICCLIIHPLLCYSKKQERLLNYTDKIDDKKETHYLYRFLKYYKNLQDKLEFKDFILDKTFFITSSKVYEYQNSDRNLFEIQENLTNYLNLIDRIIYLILKNESSIKNKIKFIEIFILFISVDIDTFIKINYYSIFEERLYRHWYDIDIIEYIEKKYNLKE